MFGGHVRDRPMPGPFPAPSPNPGTLKRPGDEVAGFGKSVVRTVVFQALSLMYSYVKPTN